MTNEDKKFEQYVESLRFDDAPSQGHREKLEQQLLDAYDDRAEQADTIEIEPTSLYVRKLAMAAGFLIVCGALFWGINKTMITSQHPDFIVSHPEREKLERIIEKETATRTEKKHLIAKMSTIWTMIQDQDSDALVSVLGSDTVAYRVRTWAADHLGDFGDEQTLTLLEQTIEQMQITDPNDPLVIAADKIRKRLGKTESKPNAEIGAAP